MREAFVIGVDGNSGCPGIYSDGGLCLVAYSVRRLKSFLCCLPATFLSVGLCPTTTQAL